MTVKIVLLSFLVGLINDGFAFEDECPPMDNIPCTCKMMKGLENNLGGFYGAFVTCSRDSVSEQDMASIFGALRGHKLGRLTFQNMNIPRTDVDVFKGIRIEHLELDGLSIEENIFQEGLEFFRGQEKFLEVLTVMNSFKTGAPLTHLKLNHLEKLESIIMSNNKIQEIGNDWFANGPKSLNFLFMSDNEIQEIGTRAFSALERLQIFWLKGSNLKDITRSMLPSPAPELEVIDLSSNKLTKLPTDFVSNMPALRAISLENNLIKSLSEDAFPVVVRNSLTMFIQGNPFHCDRDLKWICGANALKGSSTCASPEKLNGILLVGFCDMKSI